MSDVCLTTVLSYRPRWIVRYQHIQSVSSSGPVDDKKGMQFSEQNLRLCVPKDVLPLPETPHETNRTMEISRRHSPPTCLQQPLRNPREYRDLTLATCILFGPRLERLDYCTDLHVRFYTGLCVNSVPSIARLECGNVREIPLQEMRPSAARSVVLAF